MKTAMTVALFFFYFVCLFVFSFVFFNVGHFSECINPKSYTAIIMASGTQIFDKSGPHLKILVARMVTQN